MDEMEIGKQLGQLLQGQLDILKILEEVKATQEEFKKCIGDNKERLTKVEKDVEVLNKDKKGLSTIVVTILIGILGAIIGHMIGGK